MRTHSLKLFSKKAPQSVLLMRFSSIGDMLLLTPALEALATAWPQTCIYLATKKKMLPLLKYNPHIDKIFILEEGERLISFARRIATQHPQCILDLHNKMRSKFLRLYFWRIPSLVWQNRSWQDYLPLPLLKKDFHSRVFFANRYHMAVEKLVGRPLPRGYLRYHLKNTEKNMVRNILINKQINLQKKLVAIAPGSLWETKRWPVEYFSKLVQRACKEGVQIILLGGPSDQEIGRQIQADVPGTINFCGKTSLRESAALLSYCDALVSNDSGPMHIARGLCIPVLVFFGSTDPNMFDLKEHTLLYSSQDCAPCGFNGRAKCPLRHFRCMRNITVAQAWQALQKLLQKPSSSSPKYTHA